MRALSPARHVPPIALDWVLDRPEDVCRRVDGAMVFADISGFTALSERLAAKGRIGAEELVEVLSRVFGGMTETAARRGGQLVKFGGDALLFLFEGEDAAVQAASTAVEMRAELREGARITTSVGRLELSISIGVHAGSFDLFLVGAPHRELVVLGPGVSAVVRAENAARAGQIVLSPEAAAALPGSACRPREDGELLLRWRRAPGPPTGVPPDREGYDEAAAGLLPPILFGSVDGTRPDPAHRVATIAFLKFSGTDAILAEHGPAGLAERLDGTLRIVQQAFLAEDIALLCVDCDSDGGKVFASSGVPLTSEDDEGRMLRAAEAILAAGPPLELQVGINRGHVFAAEVGSPRRAAYSAMGDTTNTAARICGRAGPGEILVHADVLAHARTRYATEPRGPYAVKGKRLPLTLYRLGAEIGQREPSDPRTLPLLGRAEELARAEQVVRRLDLGTGGVLTVAGPVGIGKSRLLREVLKGAADDVVLRVHAEPYGSSNAFRVLRDPLRALLGVERDSQDRMAARLQEAVAAVVPEQAALAALVADVLQVDVEPSPEVLALLPQHRLDRTADVIVEVLAATHPGGLILVVEDAHWADSASAHLIARIARETGVRPWVVLCARRDDGGGADLADLGDLGDRIDLGPLPDDAVRAITVAVTEAAPLRQHELDQVVRRAGGNPLFASELVLAAAELGSLDAVPTSLQGAIAAQVDVLSPPAKRALCYASVLGASFRLNVYGRLMAAEGLTVDDATYDDLTRFLEAEGENRLRFRNALLRDVVYDGLGYHLRARLHGEAGEAVERMSEDLSADADILALHYARSQQHDKAYRFACLAAERAERAHASAQAVAQLELALECAGRVEGLPAAELRAVWMRLGVARDQAGLLEAAIEAFRQAGRIPGGHAGPVDPVADGELLLRRAQVRERLGSFPVALRECTRAQRAVDGHDGPEAARLRARSLAFAATVRMRQERAALARELAHSAVAAGEACADMTAVARACSVLPWAETVLGRPDLALEGGYRARELFESLGDEFGRAQMANNLGGATYFRGDWVRSAALYREAVTAYAAAGDLTNSQLAAANLCEVLVNQARLDEAQPLLEDSARMLRASGHLWGAVFAEMHLCRLLTARGETGRAEPLLRGCVDENRKMGSGEWVYEAAVHLASCLAAQGRAQEAVDVLTETAPGAASLFDAAAALVRAPALVALGRHEEAGVVLVAGVREARTRGLEYDLARLLLVSVELGLGLGDAATDPLPAEEARALLTRLGCA